MIDYNLNFTLDERDLRLLRLLAEDSKTSYAELARTLELSRAAITKRVNALIAKGVIERFTISVSPKILGLDITTLFELTTLPARTQSIIEELETRNEVGRILMTGTASVFVFSYFVNSADMNKFLLNVLSKIEGIIELKTHVILNSTHGKSMVEGER